MDNPLDCSLVFERSPSPYFREALRLVSGPDAPRHAFERLLGDLDLDPDADSSD